MRKFDLPIDPALPVKRRCRVCDSEFVAYLRSVPLQRIAQFTPLYYCMDCDSFLHPQIYKEPPEQLLGDAKWHISVEQRNQDWAEKFFDAAQKKRNIRSVIEIGCGTGSFLSVAKSRGMAVYGHDTNPHVPAISLERHKIKVDPSIWTEVGTAERYDLVVCISLFEHIPDPRHLIAEIATYSRRTGAAAFISVPFATERNQWAQLLIDNPVAGNPLYLSDVHITHFSRKGFELMAKTFAPRELTYLYHGWMGYWIEF
jgi:SAM-dependent methyltransferase